jgi:hypothetical protein
MCDGRKCRDKARIYIRLSDAAHAALTGLLAGDETAATRSALVDGALRRFLGRLLADDRCYQRRPAAAGGCHRVFVISGEVACMLERAKAKTGYSYQEIARHAVGELTGEY